MESSQFSEPQPRFEGMEPIDTNGATCDTFRVKLYGKLHFLKRLKPAFAGDIRYQESLRKEFETGYRLEHPNLVRYISLTGDGILTEYVDGETLSQLLAAHADYFQSRKNTEKFLRQLLGALGYLHSHQVLHLDLKPDNILLTRIGHDVKLIDLGFCYTDTFADTQGHTADFAAPEQLAGGTVDERTDIYAVGKILELLPVRSIYNKVIARSTAADPAKRYQSAEAMLHALSRHPKSRRIVLVAALTIIIAVFAIFSGRQLRQESIRNTEDTITTRLAVVPQKPDSQPSLSKSDSPTTIRVKAPIPQHSSASSSPSDTRQQLEGELDQLIDVAYRATIATFCDSVFPSETVGRQWQRQSSEFHAQTLQVAADMSRKYPDISESVIQQHVESRFQNLVGHVFNRMRENGKKNIEE